MTLTYKYNYKMCCFIETEILVFVVIVCEVYYTFAYIVKQKTGMFYHNTIITLSINGHTTKLVEFAFSTLHTTYHE